jgi:hypothetical protein
MKPGSGRCLESEFQTGYVRDAMSPSKPLKDLKPLNLPPEAAKPEIAPTSHVPIYKPRWKINLDEKAKKELDESQRRLEKRAQRTPEELKIANDAWFHCGPGEATP